MLGMAQLSYDYKIPGRSCAEVYDRLFEALTQHQRGRTLLFNGRKLNAEAFVNAALMHFLDLDVTEQRAILDTYVPRLEAILAGEAIEPVRSSTITGVIRGGRIIAVRDMGDRLPPDIAPDAPDEGKHKPSKKSTKPKPR